MASRVFHEEQDHEQHDQDGEADDDAVQDAHGPLELVVLAKELRAVRNGDGGRGRIDRDAVAGERGIELAPEELS